jgi:O-antigen/teichoic acid export membrane protein
MTVGGRVFRNSAVLLGGQTVERILKLVLMAVLARYLGKSSFGLYVFVLTYVEFFHLLTDLGLQIILVREMARGPEQADELLGSALILKLIFAIVSTLLALFVIQWAGYPASTAVLVGWAALGLFLSFRLGSVRQVFDSVFQVRLEMRTPVALGVASEFLSAIGLLAAVWWELDLAVMLAIQNLAYLPGAIVLLWLTKRRISLKPKWSGRTLLALLRESYPLGLSGLFTLAYVKLDILMLSAMVGDESVGVYAAAYKLTGSLNILPAALLGSLFPLMAQYARTAPDVLPRLFQRSLNAILMISIPLAIGGTILAREIIQLVYGERFADASLVFGVLIWAVAFSFVSYLLTAALSAVDRQRLYLGLTALMTVLNVVLNLFWIPRYGFIGAAAATLITEATLMILCLRLFVDYLKELELIPILKFALSGGVMGVVLSFFPFGLLASIPLALLVYVGCLFALRAVSRGDWETYLSAVGIGPGETGGSSTTGGKAEAAHVGRG